MAESSSGRQNWNRRMGNTNASIGEMGMGKTGIGESEIGEPGTRKSGASRKKDEIEDLTIHGA